MKLWYGIFAAFVLGYWAGQERLGELVDPALLQALNRDGWLREWVS